MLVLLAVLAAVAAAVGSAFGLSASQPRADHHVTTPAWPYVRVVGDHLVDGAGKTVRLIGVNRSGTEYACIQGWGIFDGPSSAQSVRVIRSWHANAVRLPLNEDCWLGINGVKPNLGGPSYRRAIEAYVRILNSAGLVAILDLHWNAPGGAPATGQQDMADADHSISFWYSVARTFRSDHGVVFDLYNEPHDISWACWLNGCGTPGWRTAGMQQMLDAVRRAGATNPVMVGGLGWSSDLTSWLSHEPKDPLHQLIASVHIYNFGGCSSPSCWNETIGPLSAKVPVVSGEIGENDCAGSFISSYMSFADRHGISYLAWAWDTASCRGEPALIVSYKGVPTGYGRAFKAHLRALASKSSS